MNMRLSAFSGQQFAQVDNPDPFAPPVFRSPVLHTPGWIIAIVQLWRFQAGLIRFLARHPVADTAGLALAGAWYLAGWPGPVVLTVLVIAALVAWRYRWPGSYAHLVCGPALGKWRRWHYHRHWLAVMTISRLAPMYQGRILVPVLGKVTATRHTDRVPVKIVSGQCPADFALRADNLAHSFGAIICRIRAYKPGWIILEFVRRDALAQIITALPIQPHVNLKALPVGRREDGSIWHVRLLGTHLLIAGATGAGKGSVIWGLIRALLPAMTRGMVRVHAADPKLMELAFGRVLFERYGSYTASPQGIAAMLTTMVARMQDRAARKAGKHRDHTPTPDEPFEVIIVDEIAFLTAYQTDRALKDSILRSLATLTTQGRAVGYCVIAALQDPRKEVLVIRNLFPDRIAMRLDEPSQTDMVLGDGAHDRGAYCEYISTDPATGAGVGFIRLENDPDPAMVRAAWNSDDDIKAMCGQYAPDIQFAPARLAIEAGAAA